MTDRDPFSLNGAVALVTGAGGGIGQGIAAALAAGGADVALLGRREAPLQPVRSAMEEQGARCVAVTADVTSADAFGQAVDTVEAALGAVTILVNAAGTQPQEGTAVDLSEATWDEMMHMMVRGTWIPCQVLGRRMIERGGGKIVNLASTFSFIVHPHATAYATAKGAVLQLTRSLAAGWAPYRVNVNAVAPTGVRTEANAHMLDDPDFLASFLPSIPAGRLARPEDVGWAVRYLASPAADMVHGHTLLVDGGYTLL